MRERRPSASAGTVCSSTSSKRAFPLGPPGLRSFSRYSIRHWTPRRPRRWTIRFEQPAASEGIGESRRGSDVPARYDRRFRAHAIGAASGISRSRVLTRRGRSAAAGRCGNRVWPRAPASVPPQDSPARSMESPRALLGAGTVDGRGEPKVRRAQGAARTNWPPPGRFRLGDRRSRARLRRDPHHIKRPTPISRSTSRSRGLGTRVVPGKRRSNFAPAREKNSHRTLRQP